jgi:hypothetical protein
MTSAQVTSSHLARQAAIYIRQSTVEQVTHNLESQRRQYGLVDRAVNLGWPRPQVIVIDDDLGVSGGGGARVGFERLVAEVGLGHIGIVLAIEVSGLVPLARPVRSGGYAHRRRRRPLPSGCFQ